MAKDAIQNSFPHRRALEWIPTRERTIYAAIHRQKTISILYCQTCLMHSHRQSNTRERHEAMRHTGITMGTHQ